MRSRLLAGSIALSCLGCSDEARTFAVEVIDGGDGVLVLSEEPSLRLEREGQPLLTFGPDAFQLGVVAAADDEVVYDPYRFYVESPLYEVPEVTWMVPVSAELTGEQTLRLTYPDGITARLVVADAVTPGTFTLELLPDGDRTAIFRLRAHGSADEGFYGLGEYFDSVDHRGKIRAMQLEADGALESSYNEAHVPVPFLTGTTGWGMFVESPYPGVFAVAHTDVPDQIEAAFGTGPASVEGLQFHLMAAAHPLDLTKAYYELTGYPRLPARWALGPWVWRDENDDQAQVESDLDMLRDLDLATNGYWIDRPYATAVNTFDFLPSQFPDPPTMYAKMRELGFRTALWHTPYLDEASPATQSLRDEAEENNLYPPENAIFLNGWGRPIDVTNPDAVAWWREHLRAYTEDLGVEGFKLDYGEDVIAGPFSTRTPWSFADGSDERTMHSQFQRHYHALYAALLPEDGGFLLCRAGTYGDQVNGPIIWPGDLDASFAKHGEKVDEDGGYVAVGGLPASVIAGLSLGPSGFPFYGADTGGYRHSPVDVETFSRWFEQTALSTVMQIGTSANDVAWELGGENGFDQAMLDRYRSYTRLHLRLFPYLWTYAALLASDGRPIQRALGLAYPELGVHPDDIYLLGDHLLVAPVVERGATSKVVQFPPGVWTHWFTGERFEGPTEATVDAPLGRLPLFLADDGIVPMLRPTIDTLSPTTDPTRVDSYDTDPGVLYARAVARGQGSFTVFDGATLEQSTTGDRSELSNGSGSELNQGVVFELIGASLPADVGEPAVASLEELDLATEGWFYDAAEKILWVKQPADHTTSITW